MRRHGTISCYQGGCRCEECRAAESVYAKRLYRLNFRSKKVPRTAAREHIHQLKSKGLGYRAIADSCGLGMSTVRRIAVNRGQWVICLRTEESILSVTAEGIADGAQISAAYTHRLLRELLEEGWTQRQLNVALGGKPRSLRVLYQQKVTARTQLRVEKLYRRAMNEGLAA